MKGYTVLCVDDEKNILQSLKRLLRKEPYRLLTVESAQAALTLLQEEPVHVIISDQRMPEMNGTDFFSKVRDNWPDIIRIILSGYTDVDSITAAVNQGHVYKFLLKPWNDQNLRLEIRQAVEQYDLIRTNRELQETILRQNEALKKNNETLEEAVRERTRELKLQNHALTLSRAVLEALPFPIVGVSAEGMIVVTNQAASHLFSGYADLSIGAGMATCFPPPVVDAVKTVLGNETPQRLSGVFPDRRFPAIEITPLSGRFKGAGTVIAFVPGPTAEKPPA